MSLTINIGVPPARINSRDLLNSGGRDFLGRPVYSDVMIKVGDRKIQFIDAIVTVEKSYTITKTSMQGRSGTVKEYIGSEDYQVTMEATIFSEDSYKFPISDMQKLIAIMDAQKQIEVISGYLALYNIHYLVPERLRVTQVMGIQGRQGVELRFVSDQDVQLTIDQEGGLAPTTPAEASFND